jgi:hypothetical protein
VPGDGGVAGLAGQRRVRVVAGAALEVLERHAGHDDLLDADLGDADLRHGVALGGRRRGRADGGGRRGGGVGRGGGRRLGRVADDLLELVLELVLRLGLPDARAPQLVGDEEQGEDPGGHARTPDGAECPRQRHRPPT